MAASIELDDFDRKILRALQANADYSMADLGSLIGLSHTPCWRRLKRLEAEGAIRGKVTLLNAQTLDLNLVVQARIRVKDYNREALDEFERRIGDIAEVLECYATTGDCDYTLKVVVNSMAHYDRLLTQELLTMPNVASLKSTVTLRQIKYSTQLPL